MIIIPISEHFSSLKLEIQEFGFTVNESTG